MITEQDLHRVQARYAAITAEEKRERNAMILQALAEGWTQRQVADATGLTHGLIGQMASAAKKREAARGSATL